MRTRPVRPRSPRRFALRLLALLALASVSLVAAAQGESPERKRAMELWERQNFVAAAPLLEKLAAESPRDAEVLSKLGFALYASTAAAKDPEARKQMRDRARTVLLQSVASGDNSNLTRIVLEALATDGATDVPFSNIREAEKAIREGEAAFARGNFDGALAAYRRALEADPNLYDAALYTGDVYFKKAYIERDAAAKQKLLDQSTEWFKRAAAINPRRETAFRYWGDALVLQGKREEARDAFVAAIIASPGDKRAYVGLTQWADKYGVKLAHPEIKVPTSVTPLKDGKMTINLDPKMLGGDGKPEDGSGAWMMYGLTRASWATDRFAKEFPREKAYRHSLREETEALRAVAEMARGQAKEGKIKKLSPSLDNLLKLDEANLLEPYVFYARADPGVVQDYEAYRQAHPDKLLRYWVQFVVRDK